MGMSEKRSDDQRRDEVLKRMLATPPKPHGDSKMPAGNVKKNKFVDGASVDIDHLSKVEKKEGAASPESSAAPNRPDKDRLCDHAGLSAAANGGSAASRVPPCRNGHGYNP